MGLTHDTERSLREYDHQAKDVSIATAAKKLSAILFVDLTKKDRYEDFALWLYENPNADHKLPGYICGGFRNIGCWVEDFKYDNY